MVMFSSVNIASIGLSPYAYVDVAFPYFSSIGFLSLNFFSSLTIFPFSLVSSLKSPMTINWWFFPFFSSRSSCRSCM